MTKTNKNTTALNYHSQGRKGKIEVIASKPHANQEDLSLAYTPGVAEPCLEIEKDPEMANLYTAKSNLIAVISNGTAVLGLGDIGPLASKPVMEGKALLFKAFADVDAFDLEIDEKDPEKLVEIIASLQHGFGGINLEDIKAPECFYVERELKKRTNIPIFHDDQHGTAIIAAAALINALEFANKKIEEVQIVFSGAGAAGIACADLFVSMGARLENIVLCDSRGVVTHDRDVEPERKRFATNRNITSLTDAMQNADVFVGVSVGNILSKENLLSMNKNPIVFALSNPTPEIAYELAMETRSDLIIATGRSDYPNQVNNVLGFPYIFRGALDVGAKDINEEMKIAAAEAIAEMAKMPVPQEVLNAYNIDKLEYSKEYLIPKPLDPRLIEQVATAVAQTAIQSGVANKTNFDREDYIKSLKERMKRNKDISAFIDNLNKS